MFVQCGLVTCAKLRQRVLMGKFQVTEPRKFYLKQNLLNLENFNPQKFPAIGTVYTRGPSLPEMSSTVIGNLEI